MAITQRKVGGVQQGGGASSTGVEQLAVTRSPSADFQQLAQSLGVLLDTSVSPHQQKQIDKASSDEYNKLEVDLKGKSPEEKVKLREEHRAEFLENNPAGLIDRIKGKPSPRLQGYNNATAKAVSYGTLDALDQLHKGFKPEDDVEYRTQAMVEMYKSQEAKAESLSPEVARQWREATMGAFDKFYSTTRDEGDELQKAEAVGVIEDATDAELTHMIEGLDLTAGDQTKAGYDEVSRSVNTINDDGTEGLDPQFTKKVFTSIQSMRDEIKIQNPQLTKDQLNVMVNEKYKWVAQMYNKPELFDALMDETNGSGQTGRTLNAKFAQETSEALYTEADKKYTALISKQEAQSTKDSKAISDDFLLRQEELASLADEGDLDAITKSQTATEDALATIQNNPNMKASHKMAMLNKARTTETINRKYVATSETEASTQAVMNAVTDLGSIKDIDMFVYRYRNASPESLKLVVAQYKKQEAELQGKTKDQQTNLLAIKSAYRNDPAKELAVDFKTVLDNTSALSAVTGLSGSFDNLAIPSGSRILNKYKQRYLTKLQAEGTATLDEYKVAYEEFTTNEMPKARAEYEAVINTFIQQNNLGGKKDSTATGTETGGSDPKSQTSSEQIRPEEGRSVADLNRIADSMIEGRQADTLSPTGGSEADKQRTNQLALDSFKQTEPIKYVQKALELGHIDVAKDAIAEDVSIALKGRRNVTPYGVVEGLLTKLSTDHPELIGTGDQVDTNLEALSGMIGQLVRDQGQSDDPRIQSLTQSKFGFNSFDRDDQVETTAGEIHELINGGLKAGLEDTPIEKEYNKLQELLIKLRGDKQ